MMLRSSSMIRSAKLQRSTCPVSMRMVSPSARAARVAHRHLAHEDRPVRLEHLELPDLVLVIALDLQQHLAAGAGREQDVVLLEQAGVVRDQVLALVRLELEPPAQRARPAAQIRQGQLRVGRGRGSCPRASPRPARPPCSGTPLSTASTFFERADFAPSARIAPRCTESRVRCFSSSHLVVLELEVDVA